MKIDSDTILNSVLCADDFTRVTGTKRNSLLTWICEGCRIKAWKEKKIMAFVGTNTVKFENYSEQQNNKTNQSLQLFMVCEHYNVTKT